MGTRFSVPVPSGSGAHPLHLGSGYRVSFKVVKLITCCMNFKYLKLSQCIYVTFLCVSHLQCHIMSHCIYIIVLDEYTSLYKCLDSQIMDF